MNSHKNARLTLQGRKSLIKRIAAEGLTPAAEAAGARTTVKNLAPLAVQPLATLWKAFQRYIACNVSGIARRHKPRVYWRAFPGLPKMDNATAEAAVQGFSAVFR